MNCTLADALRDLPISEDIKGCLLNYRSNLSDLYELMIAYEKGEWEKYEIQSSKLKLDHQEIVLLYLQAVKWVHQVFDDAFTETAEKT